MSRSIRYTVEHELLPYELYNSGPMLLFNMMGVPGKAMLKLYEKTEAACVYKEEQFTETHQEFFRDPDALLVIRVAMPTPSATLECRAVYLCYSRLGGNNTIFTSELGADGAYYLCNYDSSYRHINLGKAPESAQDETDNVASFYWEMMRNGGSDYIQKTDRTPEQCESLRAS